MILPASYSACASVIVSDTCQLSCCFGLMSMIPASAPSRHPHRSRHRQRNPDERRFHDGDTLRQYVRTGGRDRAHRPPSRVDGARPEAPPHRTRTARRRSCTAATPWSMTSPPSPSTAASTKRPSRPRSWPPTSSPWWPARALARRAPGQGVAVGGDDDRGRWQSVPIPDCSELLGHCPHGVRQRARHLAMRRSSPRGRPQDRPVASSRSTARPPPAPVIGP